MSLFGTGEVMQLFDVNDPIGESLRAELSSRASNTDAPGLLTANLWLWAFRPGSAAADPHAVVAALFEYPGLPCRHLLESEIASRPWVSLGPEAAQAALFRLLTSGVSLEIGAFDAEPSAAMDFAARILKWIDRPLAVFGSMDHRPDGSASGFRVFRVPHWLDEGLVLIGPASVGLLWFMGTD
jgi:hypothetical protein